MNKMLITLKISSNTNSYIPLKDKSSLIFCTIKNDYDFIVEVHGLLSIHILDKTHKTYICWELYNTRAKSRGRIIARPKTILKAGEKKTIFEQKIHNLFFDNNSWKWYWACRGRKESLSPIHKSSKIENGWASEIHIVVELKARLIAKVKTIEPEPEAAWDYTDKLILPISSK